MTNTINTAAVIAADAIISGFEWDVLDNPATDFEFDEAKFLSDPMTLDITVHDDEEEAGSHIASVMYDIVNARVEERDESESEEDQDDESDEDGIEESFNWRARKYRVIQAGEEILKVVSYVGWTTDGSRGLAITVSEHDDSDTTAEHLASQIRDDHYPGGLEQDFIDYADAYERDVETVDELDLDDLDDKEFEIETEDGVEYLRRALVEHLSTSAAA